MHARARARTRAHTHTHTHTHIHTHTHAHTLTHKHTHHHHHHNHAPCSSRHTRALTTTQQVLEGPAELDGHDVVEDGVDGAVDVDEGAGEHEEPQVEELVRGEGVVDDHDSVGHPQGPEHQHHHHQHADHLRQPQPQRIGIIILGFVCWLLA